MLQDVRFPGFRAAAEHGTVEDGVIGIAFIPLVKGNGFALKEGAELGFIIAGDFELRGMGFLIEVGGGEVESFPPAELTLVEEGAGEGVYVS